MSGDQFAIPGCRSTCLTRKPAPCPRSPPKRHPYNQWAPDARALDLVGDKWTLLIVRDLAGGPRRFVELQRVLPGISTEQLRSRLNRMVADGLLTRQRYREVPPRVDYELTERARDLLPVVGALSRWGYRWAWGAAAAGRGDRHRRDPAQLARASPSDGGLRGSVEVPSTRPAAARATTCCASRRHDGLRAARGARGRRARRGHASAPGSTPSGPDGSTRGLADRGRSGAGRGSRSTALGAVAVRHAAVA